jgi:large subunit ribosomal protein L15e
MGASKYIRKAFQEEWKGSADKDYDYRSIMQARTIEYRKEPKSILKIDGPTNIPAARKVGYRAKQGIFVVRAGIRKGSGTYHRPKNKRRPKRQGQAKLTRRISTQGMAEQRVSKRFENAEVLGSYKIAEDGQTHYFEVILSDRDAKTIRKDRKLKWLVFGKQKGRAERGKTSAGRANKEKNLKNKRKHISKKRQNPDKV